MTRPLLVISLVLFLPTGGSAAPPAPASASAPASQKNGDEECLGCHAGSTGTVKFEDGSKLSVGIDRTALQSSVHYRKVACVDCHQDAASGYPHPERKHRSRRAYAIARHEVCKRCHFANYTRTLESVHFRQLARGNLTAPLCTDCHGTHDVKRAGQPRRAISDGCARCHADVTRVYAQSVHGAALRADNPDVPVCTDCHRAHDVVDPRSAAFRLREPTMCGGCHADEKRMAKYKLSTGVLKTYLADFHGVTVSFRGKEKRPDITQYQAVCSDCHGVHDIRRSNDPQATTMKANIGKTCRRCHKDATDSFPAAWLSHWEPSPSRAPLVYFIQRAYGILIPFLILGLLLHVLLNVWRVTINRHQPGTGAPVTAAPAPPAAAPAPPESFRRFSNRQRLEHLVMMIAVIVLTVTGLPQKYPGAGWAETIVLGLGGIDTTRAIHRLCGAVLAIVAVEHLTFILGAMILGRARATMLVRRKDVKDAVQNLKYRLGIARQAPRLDRYDYRQKLEYWGLVLGGLVMVCTGLVLWFPTLAARFLPAAVIPASKVLHTNEAMLATLVLVVWHMYGAHFSPGVFPADTSIFTGRISRERLEREHALEYERLTAHEPDEE